MRNFMSLRLLAVLVALICLLAAPTMASAESWEYTGDRQGDYFRNIGAGNWQEIVSGDTIFSFVEVARSGGYIELLDTSRGIRVRLYSGQVTIFRPEMNAFMFFHYGRYIP